MKTLISAACLLLACRAVQAGDPNAAATVTAKAAATAKAGPTVETKPASAADTTSYEPRSKSVFTSTENDHNPFWPIGWVKTEALPAGDTGAVVNPHVEDFTVSTILLNDPPMAVINGKDMAEGEIAALSVNGQPVVVQLMAVQDGRVILRWQNQNLIVPIHREETLSAANLPQ